MKFFDLKKVSSDGRARRGSLKTSHGIIETPVFMPVGTQGAVKAMSHMDLKSLGFNLILGNTYHLYLRPGNDVIQQAGGLHEFIKWNGAILTDSGGYQVFSLKDLRNISEDGVHFKSHIDGSSHKFTPENVIKSQRILGSDIVMVFDECTSYPAEYAEAERSMDLSLRWADRCLNEFQSSSEIWNHRQNIFGIVQGGMYADLRRRYVTQLSELGFDGYAIGGLSVGEPADLMYDMVEVCTELMPAHCPRYLMGVGTPLNIIEAVDRGIDMFDCVLPTRNARNGQIFTTKGKINIRNARYKFSNELIDPSLNNGISDNFTLGYLRHLFISGEIFGLQIASYQNLAYYSYLMEQIRLKIEQNEFRQFKDDFTKNYSNFEV